MNISTYQTVLEFLERYKNEDKDLDRRTQVSKLLDDAKKEITPHCIMCNSTNINKQRTNTHCNTCGTDSADELQSCYALIDSLKTDQPESNTLKPIKIKWNMSKNPQFSDIATLIRRILANPIEETKLQGQKFGNCCFCGLELTNKSSLIAGYGPICAEKWGLPWGIKEEEENNGLENL
jgi:hypothetical protein